MDDIADRAGVSKPVLYQHFPGKLELYLALIDTHTEALVEGVRAAMLSTTDNKLRVHAAVRTYFDYVDAEGEAFRLVFETDLRNEPSVRERVDAAVVACVQAIADTIAADTHLDPLRSQLLSVGLTGVAEASARWWLQHRRDVPKEDAIALMAALAWRGISNFPRQ
jgi:AcrR family transcriptional regulator